MKKVGVLAVQGNFSLHQAALESAGVPASHILTVRTVEELGNVDRLIIPGGESTTVGLLLKRYGLGDAIQARAQGGMPLWGTCMGMILMAKAIEGRDQYSLNLLDITVKRNAFGAQVHSFEDEVQMTGVEPNLLGVFIRAPIVTEWGSAVEPMGWYQSKVVAVKQGKRIGTSFHPELTTDTRLHQYFLSL